MANPPIIKLGVYTFEKTETGFIIYTEDKSLLDSNGSPYKIRRYHLNFNRRDSGLYWSVYSCKKWRPLEGDETPKTIAQFAHAVCTESTVFSF